MYKNIGILKKQLERLARDAVPSDLKGKQHEHNKKLYYKTLNQYHKMKGWN